MLKFYSDKNGGSVDQNESDFKRGWLARSHSRFCPNGTRISAFRPLAAKNMNWKLIFLLSLFGLAMAGLTISLVPSTIEPFCWLVIFLICSYLIAKYAPGKYFLHGLLVSIVNSIWITAAQVTFYDQYIAAHPEFLQMTAGLPPDLAVHPRRMMLPIGLISGILSGIVLGLFAWVASKIFKKTPSE